jgi:hypothetical protein
MERCDAAIAPYGAAEGIIKQPQQKGHNLRIRRRRSREGYVT